jgi:hypothetical protein
MIVRCSGKSRRLDVKRQNNWRCDALLVHLMHLGVSLLLLGEVASFEPLLWFSAAMRAFSVCYCPIDTCRFIRLV